MTTDADPRQRRGTQQRVEAGGGVRIKPLGKDENKTKQGGHDHDE